MPRILFAEDGPTAMDLAGGLFDDPDIELDVVTDGRSALDRLNAAPKAYDLVVLGYDLSEISGPDCITFIRQVHRRLPVLVLSETLGEATVQNLADLGVRRKHILQKPTTREAFAGWVQAALAEIPDKGA